jgi:hypothetical protein
MKRPNTEPRPVRALLPWFYSEEGAHIEGAIIGTVDAGMGPSYVLEDEKGNRFRLPSHVDLDRKILAVLVQETTPWIEVKQHGFMEDERTRRYDVNHYPRN